MPGQVLLRRVPRPVRRRRLAAPRVVANDRVAGRGALDCL